MRQRWRETGEGRDARKMDSGLNANPCKPLLILTSKHEQGHFASLHLPTSRIAYRLCASLADDRYVFMANEPTNQRLLVRAKADCDSAMQFRYLRLKGPDIKRKRSGNSSQLSRSED